MKLNILDTTGKKSGALDASDNIFNVSVNSYLLALAVRVYLHNQRQWTKKVQTRADVNYSTAKVWRQKGTGRARHGSRRAPIFVGGGQAHGPSTLVDARMKITKKMRNRALCMALSQKLADKKLIFISESRKLGPKVSQANQILTSLNPNFAKEKTLIILATPERDVMKATQNLKNVSVSQAARINVYEILNHDTIICNPESLDIITKRLDPTSYSPKISVTKKVATKTKT